MNALTYLKPLFERVNASIARATQEQETAEIAKCVDAGLEIIAKMDNMHQGQLAKRRMLRRDSLVKSG